MIQNKNITTKKTKKYLLTLLFIQQKILGHSVQCSVSIKNIPIFTHIYNTQAYNKSNIQPQLCNPLFST